MHFVVPPDVEANRVHRNMTLGGRADLAQEWCNINQSDREEVFVAAGLILEYMRANGADVPHYLTAACAWVCTLQSLLNGTAG